MHRFLVTARIRPGSEEAVRAILREGPPFQLPETTLERHTVFVCGDEIVFLFEGVHADAEVKRLVHERNVLGQAGRIGLHLAGRPRFPEEVFAWSRPELLEGVTFVATPGPGDSEGGAAE